VDIKGLPIDLGRFSGRIVMIAPRPRVNTETGELRPDRDGQPVFLVGVAMVKDGTNEAQILDIQVTSALVGIEPGTVVELEDLEATPWNFNGRTGLSWKVSKITASGPAGIKAVPDGLAPGVDEGAAGAGGIKPPARKGSTMAGSDAA
jgi:hypothetical protein